DSHDGETAHDVSEETSYQTCIANGGYVGKELSPTSGLPVLIIDMPITDPDTGEIIGTVGNAMALSVLTESMMNSFGEGSDYSVYMLDSEGVVIASANEDDILNLDFTTENDTTAAVMEQIAAEETGTVQFSLAGVSNKGAYSTSNGMTTLVYMSTTAYMKSIEHMIANIVIIAGVCVVIAVIVITIVSTWIIKPMSQMVSLIEKYGDADFSSEVPAALIRRKDEIGTLGKSMDKMQKVIKEIFENIINETERVSGNVNDSKGEMTELAGRIGTVNDLVSDRAAESEETAASTEIISENALSVKDAVVEITEQTQKGMEMSDDINERASELKSDAVKAQDEVTRLTSELRDKLNDAVEQSKAVNQINALSDAILDIASETSLLSLNASIEAARAGEAGRGFAVVAEQIGKLADNSQKSAVQIQDITGQVVIAVNNLADNSLDAIRFIDENIMSDYQSMVDTGENYYNDAMSFRGLMENINGKADMLMDSIGAMTNSVGEISTANMEGAEGITNISHNTADIQNMSVRVSDIMDSVQDSTVKLKETVNKLTV
ncbi:MAG: methyl-accepting chemotaxis protein, partial [Lachnospiraceae bacterium]|nr:methyl-accepting chemotaxis protein [Lachnospiraceae bacterium]